MMLREQFRTLGLPSGEAEFVAEQVKGRAHVRLGRDRAGRAAILIEHVGSELAPSGATIELRNVAFFSSAECEIISSDGTRSGSFAIIRWKSEPGHLQELFLQVVGSWLPTIGEPPSVRAIRGGFDRLAQIFAALDAPSSRDVTGLWGELLLIANAKDPELLVRAWHVDPNELHDFQLGTDLLEVKTTVAGVRRHDFSLVQLTTPADGQLIVASLLLSAASPTMSLTELVDRVKARLSSDELRLRVDAIVLATLGVAASSALSHGFNSEVSASSIRFYRGSDVPTVSRQLPPEVSDVRFKAELDGLAAMGAEDLNAAGALFRASPGPVGRGYKKL